MFFLNNDFGKYSLEWMLDRQINELNGNIEGG